MSTSLVVLLPLILLAIIGALQDVAIYNDVLKSGEIVTHFHNGSGTDP
jgi:hypothetical protein